MSNNSCLLNFTVIGLKPSHKPLLRDILIAAYVSAIYVNETAAKGHPSLEIWSWITKGAILLLSSLLEFYNAQNK